MIEPRRGVRPDQGQIRMHLIGKAFHRTAFAGAVLLLPSIACAQTAAAAPNTGDTAWVLTSTALVLFMTLPGLALFYGGLVRSKNVLSVMAQCVAIACLASVLWLLVGYSLAFSGSGPLVSNLGKA